MVQTYLYDIYIYISFHEQININKISCNCIPEKSCMKSLYVMKRGVYPTQYCQFRYNVCKHQSMRPTVDKWLSHCLYSAGVMSKNTSTLHLINPKYALLYVIGHQIFHIKVILTEKSTF